MRSLFSLCGLAAASLLALLLLRPANDASVGYGSDRAASRTSTEPLQSQPALSRHTRTEPEQGGLPEPPTSAEPAPAATWPQGRLRGIVLDRERRVVSAARVTFEAWAGAQATAPGQVSSDSEGRFEVQGLAARAWRIRATADDLASRWSSAIASANPEPIELVIDTPRRVLTVQVLAADGRPAVAIETWLEHASASEDADGLASGRAATTDGYGLARFVVPWRSAGFVCVRDHRGTTAAVDFSERDTLLRLPLGAPARLRGKVLGAEGVELKTELAQGRVTISRVVGTESSGPQHFHFTEVAVTAGGYAFADLPPGTYGLSWSGTRGLALAHARMGSSEAERRYAELTVELVAGEARNQDLTLLAAGAIAGLVSDESGHPVAGATTTVRRRGLGWDPFGWMGPGVPMQRFDALPWPNAVDPAATREVTSESDGRYELAGLAPGTYAVTIRAPGRTSMVQVNTEVRAEAVTQVLARLVPAGVLQLVVDPKSHVGVFPEGASSAVAAFVAPADGTCVLQDLAPGRYVLESLGLGRPRLAEATVVAGRTTWVDARNLGKHQLRGCVLANGVPVAGAQVGTFQRTTRTDERGAYLLRGHQRIAAEAANRLQVHHDGARWSFWIPDSATELDCELGSTGLAVRLVDAEGGPLEGTVTVMSGDHTAVHFEARMHTHNGMLRLPHLPGASAQVEVKFDGGGCTQAQVPLPAREALTLVAPGEGAIDVLLLDARGVPLPGMHVSATEVREAERYGENVQRTDEHGRVRIGGLQLRPHTVKVFHWMTTGDEAVRDPLPEVAVPRRRSGTAVTLRMQR